MAANLGVSAKLGMVETCELTNLILLSNFIKDLKFQNRNSRAQSHIG